MGFRFGIWRCGQGGLCWAAASPCLLPPPCIHEIPKHRTTRASLAAADGRLYVVVGNDDYRYLLCFGP
jgi:hypothetical protein